MDDLLTEEPIEVLLRPMNAGDINLVTNSWLKNYRKAYFARGVHDSTYYAQHHKVLQKLIPKCVVMVACNPADPSYIYGWLCGEYVANHVVIHYVWVRETYKHVPHKDPTRAKHGRGIGTMMLQKLLSGVKPEDLRGVVYTHETWSGHDWLHHCWDVGMFPDEPTYNPYFLFREAL